MAVPFVLAAPANANAKSRLRIWYYDSDFCIAESAEDAERLFVEELLGGEPVGPPDVSKWKPWPDGKPFTRMEELELEEEPAVSMEAFAERYPEIQVQTRDDGWKVVTAPPSVWCAVLGPGFFATTEC